MMGLITDVDSIVASLQIKIDEDEIIRKRRKVVETSIYNLTRVFTKKDIAIAVWLRESNKL